MEQMELTGSLIEGKSRLNRPAIVRRATGFAVLTLVVGLVAFPSDAQETTTTTSTTATTTSTTAPTTSQSTTTTVATTTTAQATTTTAQSSTTSPGPTTTAQSTTTTDPSSTTTAAESTTSMPVAEENSDREPAGTVSEDLAGALSVWNERVREKEKELETAEARLDAAEARFAGTQVQIDAIRNDLVDLEVQVASRAISAFMDQDLSEVGFFSYDQVQEATRMRTLLASAVKTDFDIAEDLRIAQEELAIQQAIADEAQKEADEARVLIADELVEVEKARDQKASLTAKAAASLGVVTDADIVTVRGFKVRYDIADAVAGMIDYAAAQGVRLGGGGYRSFESQIEIRKNNCGTSYYAIWQMPSRNCRPPTARPGASMHEQGLALDLTCDGALIRSRSSHCFQWLAANAGDYGFKNLPSEPWHWSVNGR